MQKIDQKIPKFNKHFRDYLKKKLSLLLLQPVSEKETMSVTGNINTRKGVGPNSVLNLILKELLSKILKKVVYSRLSKFLDK